MNNTLYTNNMNTAARHSKKDAKLQKIQKKLGGSLFTKKQIQQQLKNLEEQRNDSFTQDPILKRATRWWQRLDQKYFRSICLEDVINKRDQLTGDQISQLQWENVYSPFGTYRSELAISGLQFLNDSTKIKVFYLNRSENKSVIAVYSVQNCQQDQNQNTRVPTEEQQNGSAIRITAKPHKPYLIDEQIQQTEESQKKMSEIMKTVRLELQDFEQNETTCRRIKKISQIEENIFHLHQIDKQIAMWEEQLSIAAQENYKNWNHLIQKIQVSKELSVLLTSYYDQEILQTKDKLYWGVVLKSFQHGFKDKTHKMLQVYIENQKNFNLKPPKGLPGQTVKKFFQTDCKICFSSDNSDSNQVLYCDSCNTSFHLYCYGLTSVPPEDKYYCERCTYIQKQQQIGKLKKPTCQICLKTAFPMKKMNDHFYHVTCLVLFNFVEFRQNKMVLKGSLSHENIIKMVIENELMHQQCNQCRKTNGGSELGMQIKCIYEGCQNWVHPICAYLNGISKMKSLDVEMFCNQHLGNRTEQIYLRRYMCNLKETSSKNLSQFKQIFQKEVESLQTAKQSLLKQRKKYPNRIMMVPKMLKNLLKSRSQNKSNQEEIQTQTRQILQKLKKNKN